MRPSFWRVSKWFVIPMASPNGTSFRAKPEESAVDRKKQIPRFARNDWGRLCLQAFDNRGNAHAAAYAQRRQAVTQLAPLKFVEHGAEDHRAGGA